MYRQGLESDTSSSVIDSGDKWDKSEVRVWSHCPTQTAKIGPTWAEVHTAVQEEQMNKKQDPTWEDIVSRHLPGDAEEEDWGGEEGSLPMVEPQFKDTSGEEEEKEVVVELVTEEKLEPPGAGEPPTEEPGEATLDPGSQDVVQIQLERMAYNKHVPLRVQHQGRNGRPSVKNSLKNTIFINISSKYCGASNAFHFCLKCVFSSCLSARNYV